MSSRSICEFVRCESLKENGCSRFKEPKEICPIGKFGFERDRQIFADADTFAYGEFGEIYECVHENLVAYVKFSPEHLLNG